MTILFTHQKGGVGKSTVAINFAYRIRKKYKEIAILDLDSQHSAILFNRLRETMKLPTIRCHTQDDVDLKKVFDRYKGDKSNLLVVDSGGYDSDINRMALLKADLIVTPVGISQIEIFGLQKFAKLLKEASTVLDRNVKTNVLLNNIDSRSKSKLTELRKYIEKKSNHFDLLETILYSRADYKNSYGEGMTVGEYNKKGKAKKEIDAFSKEIYGLLKN